MSTTTITTLASLIRFGELDDYRAQEPSRGAAEIDRDVAAGCTCTACGHVGLGYRPFIRPAHGCKRRSYRPFAVCSSCGHCEEF